MKALIAVKRYMEADGGRKVSMEELKAFKAACSADDYAGYAAELSEIFGESAEV